MLLPPESEPDESAPDPTATFPGTEFAPRERASPLTVLGVIAPRVNVKAGVVVELATVAETPFAVVTETDVTVPEPPAAGAAAAHTEPFEVRTQEDVAVVEVLIGT